MSTSSFKLFALAAASLMVLSSGADAQGKSQDKNKDKDKKGDVVRVTDPRHDTRDDRGQVVRVEDPRYPTTDPRRGGDSRRDDSRRATDGTRRVPPGLAKKPGGMPPGQYKKLHRTTRDGAVVLGDVLGRRGYTVIRTADAGDSRYVYYRTRDGVTQRAIVSPGSERLRFSNVPGSLMSEVLSRLY
jgi:hypothetical protein